jgi:hypothetical protein
MTSQETERSPVTAAQASAMREAKLKACAHWASQLQSLFPQTQQPITPEFMVAMAALMAGYSEKVLKAVCSPVTGIATKMKFMPTLFELKQALEEEARPFVEDEARQKRIKEQLSEREKVGQYPKVKYPTLESMRATYPDFMKKQLGIIPDDTKYNFLKEEELLKKYNVTKQELDTIPNHPEGVDSWKKVERRDL